MDTKKKQDRRAPVRDPIRGAPGGRPVGLVVGAAFGGAAGGAALWAVANAAAAGAAFATVVGPMGAAVGVIAGGVAGAFVGRAIAETLNPEERRSRDRPGRTRERAYQDAYRFGTLSRAITPGERFADRRGELRQQWERNHPEAAWDLACPAIRDGWDGIDRRSASVGPGNSRILDD